MSGKIRNKKKGRQTYTAHLRNDALRFLKFIELLVNQNDYENIYEFCIKLNISESTLKRYMFQMRSAGFKIHSKKFVGIEIDKRQVDKNKLQELFNYYSKLESDKIKIAKQIFKS